MAECVESSANERNKECLSEAKEFAEESVAILKKLNSYYHDQNDSQGNLLLAQRIQTLADILRDMGDEHQEECEKHYNDAKTIISGMFGEDHPAVINYNGNLVTFYTSVDLDKHKQKVR